MTAYSCSGITGFSGSYAPSDVEFLLKTVEIQTIDVDNKERLIQNNLRHYSEMIGFESAPNPEYEAIFKSALDAGAARMGRDVARLAKALAQRISGPITLASLVRAGVPLGILLKRALSRLGVDVVHYGISIIRDRGIDPQALACIADQRPAKGVVFVDGWTGKGAIATELERSLQGHPDIAPRLVVGADPCGRAWLAATGDDWLIPSGILGATVSGLISRTILNDDVIFPGDFHGCMSWSHLRPYDRSRAYIATVWPFVEMALNNAKPALWRTTDRAACASTSTQTIEKIAALHNVGNLNRIKPGIAEATRAILRRAPERVFVANRADHDLSALLHLAAKADVPVEILPGGIAPYRAVTLIRHAV